MRSLRHPVLGDELVAAELDCGLQVYAYLKPELERRHALLAVDYGSADAGCAAASPKEPRPTPHGIAHFLEHRLFEKADGDMAARFTALGAEVDAHTTFTTTAFSCTCLDRFPEALELLLELVLTAHFSDAAVRRERDIITREIELYEDSVEWVAFSAALRSLYGGTALGDDIAGTPASLARLDRPVLESCYGAHYRPGRMILVVAGDVDVAQILEAARRVAGGKAAAAPPWRRPAMAARPRREVRYLSTAMPRLLVAGACPPLGLAGLPLLRHELCLDLALDILFGPSSAFYCRHYEAGLVDDETFGYEIYCEPAFAFSVVGGDTPDPERLEAEIVRQVAEGLQGDLVAAGLQRSLRRAWGQLLCRYEEVEGCAAMVHSEVSRRAEPFDSFTAFQQVRPADVVAALHSCLGAPALGVAAVRPHGSCLLETEAQ